MKDLVKTGNIKLPCSIQSDWEMKGQISVTSTATNCKKVIKPISLKNKWQDILVSRWLIRSDIVHIRSDQVLIHVVCTLHFLICDKSACVYMLCCPLLQAGIWMKRNLFPNWATRTQIPPTHQLAQTVTLETIALVSASSSRNKAIQKKRMKLTVILHGAITGA